MRFSCGFPDCIKWRHWDKWSRTTPEHLISVFSNVYHPRYHAATLGKWTWKLTWSNIKNKESILYDKCSRSICFGIATLKIINWNLSLLDIFITIVNPRKMLEFREIQFVYQKLRLRYEISLDAIELNLSNERFE